jgi:hypothetical protein
MTSELHLLRTELAALGFPDLDDEDVLLCYLLIFDHDAGVKMWRRRIEQGQGGPPNDELKLLILSLSSLVKTYQYKNLEEFLPVINIVKRYGRECLNFDRKTMIDLKKNPAIFEIHIYSKLRHLA